MNRPDGNDLFRWFIPPIGQSQTDLKKTAPAEIYRLTLGLGSLTLGLCTLCILGVFIILQPAHAGEHDPPVSLRFGEFYQNPVGPEGLEPSEKLLGLANQSVSLLGYVVDQNPQIEGHIILSPLPVLIDQEDESLADDLPPSAVFVHFDPNNAPLVDTLTRSKGRLVKVQGVLTLGAQEEPDGRVSHIQLHIE